MEMQAAIEALQSLRTPCSVDLYTDSTYVKDGITRWLEGWKRNRWRTASKKPVKNQDLWETLDAALQQHDVAFHWVNGHDGDPLNERADALARNAITQNV